MYRDTRSGETVELVTEKMYDVILRRTAGHKDTFSVSRYEFEQHYVAVQAESC